MQISASSWPSVELPGWPLFMRGERHSPPSLGIGLSFSSGYPSPRNIRWILRSYRAINTWVGSLLVGNEPGREAASYSHPAGRLRVKSWNLNERWWDYTQIKWRKPCWPRWVSAFDPSRGGQWWALGRRPPHTDQWISANLFSELSLNNMQTHNFYITKWKRITINSEEGREKRVFLKEGWFLILFLILV